MKLILISGIVFILGWIWMAVNYQGLITTESLLHPYYSRSMNLEGVVQAIRKTKSGKFRYHLVSLNPKDSELKLRASFGIFLYSRDSIACSTGDVLKISNGILSEIGGPRNPGEFDYHRFYLFRKVIGRMSLNDSSNIAVIPSEQKRPSQYLECIRYWIQKRFENNLDRRSGPLLTALILGNKDDLDPGLIQEFQRIGVIHVLAVSGLHVGYILLILIIIVRIMRIPWGWDRIIILAGLGFYTALTGFRPSVIRAASMSGLYMLAPLFNRRPNPLNIIGAVALIMLGVNPTSLFKAGFQLSFLAVISIIGFLEFIEPGLPGPLRIRSYKNAQLRGIYGLVLVSLAAQLGTLPITLSMFHTIPLIGLMANSLIVPLIGIIVSLGFLLLISVGIPMIGYSVSQAIFFLNEIISWIASVLAGIDWASITLSGSPFVLVALIYSGLSGILFILNRKRFKPGLFLSLILLTGVTWSWAVKPLELEILFLDVGQGDSMIIRLPDQRTVLIDGGPKNYWRDSGQDILLPVFRFLGITHFNWIVLTHPHSDHLGGLLSVVQSIPVDTVITNNSRTNSHQETRFYMLLDSAGIVVDTNRTGTMINGGKMTGIQFLWPPNSSDKNGNINNRSVVISVSDGNLVCLLMGDLEMQGERELMSRWVLPNTELLKLGHHGSITGTLPEFLDAINPRIAVISVGARNKFGHPSPIVLKRLKHRKIRIHRTDNSGALWIRMHNDQLDSLIWK
ncbi:MAG: DNA internalization-related competence protein ComEC/Rec2 [FCB group bacterium]|nr:DNA internalization-related competence protein ComEC/Rec2 [FCB group bacterium]